MERLQVLCLLAINFLIPGMVYAQCALEPLEINDGGGTAGTLVVSPTGSGTACTNQSPCSVNEALGKVDPGETVLFKDGTYAQRITITRSGSAGAHVVLKAENNREAKIIVSNVRILAIEANFITVDGFFLDDLKTSNTGNATIRVDPDGGNHHIIVENSTIFQAGNRGFVVNGEVTKSHDVIFRNNIINGTGYLNDGDSSGHAEALYIGRAGSSGEPGVDDIAVYGNVISDVPGNFIDFKPNVTRAWLFNNVFHTQVLFSDHGVPERVRDGAILIQGSQTCAYNNIIRDGDAGGQILKVRTGTLVEPNKIYNNIIFNITANRAIQFLSSGTSGAKSQIFNNTFFNVSNASIQDANQDLVVKNNIGIDGRADNLTKQLAVSSLFVDSANEDFHLVGTANNVIDKATQTPFTSNDFDGDPISGAARDYGAFEFTSFTFTCN